MGLDGGTDRNVYVQHLHAYLHAAPLQAGEFQDAVGQTAQAPRLVAHYPQPFLVSREHAVLHRLDRGLDGL